MSDSKFFNDPKFKKLNKEWQEKLKQDGKFVDIEDSKGRFTDHGTLYDLQQRKDFATADTLENHISYYQWCRSMVDTGFFKDDKDKAIWAEHSEGTSNREIGKELDIPSRTIDRAIKRIKKYLQAQKGEEDAED